MSYGKMFADALWAMAVIGAVVGGAVVAVLVWLIPFLWRHLSVTWN